MEEQDDDFAGAKLVDELPDGEKVAADELDEQGEDQASGLVQTVNYFTQFLESEGVTSLSQDYDQFSALIGRARGIAVEADEVARAAAETVRLKAEQARLNRKVGLTFSSQPWGLPVAEEAVDHVLTSLTPVVEQKLYADLAGALDVLGDGQGHSDEQSFAALQLAQKTVAEMTASEPPLEPRKVVYSEKRMRGWLMLKAESQAGSAGLTARQVRQLVQNALLAHKDTLQAKNLHLSNPFDNEYPITDELVKEVENVQRIMGRRIEELPEFFEGDLDRVKQFAPAVDEYMQELVKFGLSGARACVSLPTELHDVQAAIEKSRNFGAVFQASRVLSFSMQRLYVVHWVCESLCKEIAVNNEVVYQCVKGVIKSADVSKRRKSRTLTVGKVLAAMAQAKPELAGQISPLRYAVNFRNKLAHEGVVWKPAQFQKHIKAYDQGIATLQEYFGLGIESIRVKPEQRELTAGAVKSRLHSYLLSQGSSLDRLENFCGAEQVNDLTTRLRRRGGDLQDNDFRYTCTAIMLPRAAEVLFSTEVDVALAAIGRWSSGHRIPSVRNRHPKGTLTLLAWNCVIESPPPFFQSNVEEIRREILNG